MGLAPNIGSIKHRSYFAEIKNLKNLLFVKDIHYNLILASGKWGVQIPAPLNIIRKNR